MSRRLQPDSNGNLEFTELVYDEDKEDVDHPFPTIVRLDKIDGTPVSTAENEPDWLFATVSELGVNAQKERWEEKVTVIILDPEENLQANTTYTFRFQATDGVDTTDRLVNLKVS